jgi:hypothetical protein
MSTEHLKSINRQTVTYQSNGTDNDDDDGGTVVPFRSNGICRTVERYQR